MSRLPPLVYEELNDEQKKLYDVIASTRDGVVSGPQIAKIRIPPLSYLSQAVSDILRSNTSLKKTQFEVLILIVGREFNADYVWGAHDNDARKAGLPEKIIDDINYRRRPAFDDEADEVIYDVGMILAKGQTLPQDLFDKAVKLLGMNKLIEAATDVGYYMSACMTAKTYALKARKGTNSLA